MWETCIFRVCVPAPLPLPFPHRAPNPPSFPCTEGDGEISFCGAIEIAGLITLKTTILKNGLSTLGIKSPIFLPGPVEPHYGPGRYLTFEGFSVDEKGKQHYMDATVAYRQTTLRVIEYLKRFGYSDYQVYLLLSCAPVQGHVAGIVDVGLPFLLGFWFWSWVLG